eukprot:240133-Pelagomonas_calceolata.AAC.5
MCCHPLSVAEDNEMFEYCVHRTLSKAATHKVPRVSVLRFNPVPSLVSAGHMLKHRGSTAPCEMRCKQVKT